MAAFVDPRIIDGTIRATGTVLLTDDDGYQAQVGLTVYEPQVIPMTEDLRSCLPELVDKTGPNAPTMAQIARFDLEFHPSTIDGFTWSADRPWVFGAEAAMGFLTSGPRMEASRAFGFLCGGTVGGYPGDPAYVSAQFMHYTAPTPKQPEGMFPAIDFYITLAGTCDKIAETDLKGRAGLVPLVKQGGDCSLDPW